jgi:methionyl-tRNA synthetase
MKVLVTAALPYANGDVHIGTLAGSNLPADIYSRYLRSKGVDVLHICGTDEHGVPITLQAEREGVSPQVIVDKYYERIRSGFQRFGIQFDNFSRTTRQLHHRTAQDFFLRLHEKGLFEPRVVEQFYCEACRRFLPDRYVEGSCPYCSATGARGDQCDICGRWLEPSQLVNPTCQICGKSPNLTSTKHWFLRLSRFQAQLEEWIGSKVDWRENVRNFCQNLLTEGLKDRPVTRDLEWGVPVPLEEAEGKVLYVWFEALIGYISSTMEWAEKSGDRNLWKDYWRDPATKVVHFIGKDNIIFHAIVWPAMLLGHGDYPLPAQIPANEFMTLSGRKISTSRNWAIWLSDYLERFEPDPLRYVLTMQAPETGDSDFSWGDFQQRNNTELADVFGNFVNRTLGFVHGYLGGRIPQTHQMTTEDREFKKAIIGSQAHVGEFIEQFQFRKGLKEVMALAALGNRYFDYSRPWETRKGDRKRCETSLGLCCRLTGALAVLAEPFMPAASEKIREMLHMDAVGWDELGQMSLSGMEIGRPTVLFKKIADETIEMEVSRLNTPESAVEFADFEKIDLRIAEVKEAAQIEGTTKLLRLVLSLGEEEVEVVAGIAEHYGPEEVVGKRVVLVHNLKPAVIRGVTSHGMILAATEGNDLALLVPDREMRPGSKIS